MSAGVAPGAKRVLGHQLGHRTVSRLELSRKSPLRKARERPDLVRQVIDRARSEGIRDTQASVRRKLLEETPVGYSSAGYVLEVGAAVGSSGSGDAVAGAGGGACEKHEGAAERLSSCRPSAWASGPLTDIVGFLNGRLGR
jgi:hypothetical protein